MNAFIKGTLVAAISAAIATSVPTPASSATYIGGFVLFSNYHTRQSAFVAVGYTTYGGTIYGDGRIIMPNNAIYYPNAYGRYPWGAYVYYNPHRVVYHYDYARSYRWDRTALHGRGHGHAYGHYKMHENNGHHYGHDHG